MRRFRAFARGAVHPVLSVLFPARCFACQASLGPAQVLGACSSCWAGLLPLLPPVCRTCGLPLTAGTDLLGPARGRCAACVLSPPELDGIRAAVVYDALGRSFLLEAKLARRREILAPLGRQLAGVLERSEFAHGCTVVVPVPSHPWTLLRRGYNPAFEIAKPVGRTLGIPLRPRLLWRRLLRGGASKSARAEDRRRLVRDAFRARTSVRGQRVLLVDDVMTTGATLAACTRSLREAGAETVRGAVWARTPYPTVRV